MKLFITSKIYDTEKQTIAQGTNKRFPVLFFSSQLLCLYYR